jgi:hypothetical protein
MAPTHKARDHFASVAPLAITSAWGAAVPVKTSFSSLIKIQMAKPMITNFV